MHANIGDRIVIQPYCPGQDERAGEVVEVQGRNGEPPYIVRWTDSGRLALFYPGGDAHVQHADSAR